jgi:hypothetical protein
VTLQGGPLDGATRLIHPASSRYFEEWDAGPADQWPPPARRRAFATYRRADEGTFVWAATQTALGAPTPELYTPDEEEGHV